LVLIMLAGALIRQFFVARHKTETAGQGAPCGWAIAGVALLIGVAVWLVPPSALAPAPKAADTAAAPLVSMAELQPVIEQRCVMCHSEQLANKGVMLHTPALIQQHAQQIYQQVVVLKAMPMNNATGMTDAERALLAQWFKQGLASAPAP